MKKIVSLLVLLSIMMSLPIIAFGNERISIYLDNQAVAFEQSPIIEDGRTLVPFRAILEGMGAEVSWDETTRTVTAVKGELHLSLQIGNTILTKNGEEIKMDVAPKIVNNYTLVPVRAVAENLNNHVYWEELDRAVVILTEAYSKEVVLSIGEQTFTVGKLGYMAGAYKNAQFSKMSQEEYDTFWTTVVSGMLPEERVMDTILKDAEYILTYADIAARNSITVSDDEVDARLNLTPDLLQSVLSKYKTTENALRSVLKKQIMMEKFSESLANDPRLNPDDDTLKTIFYDTYFKAQHILKLTLAADQQTPLPDEEKEKKKAEANLILLKVMAGEDFTEVMLENGEDPGSQRQPDGYVFTYGMMVAPFEKAVTELKENEISAIVETSYGYHIIKRLPLGESDFTDAKSNVLKAYQTEEKKKIISEYMSGTIEKNEALINSFVIKY